MANINYYSRYELNTSNGSGTTLPFITLTPKTTDKQVVWVEGVSRMDVLSNTYYGQGIYGIVIMMANPEWAMEYDIPNNTIITIPFPLEDTLKDYFNQLSNIANTN